MRKVVEYVKFLGMAESIMAILLQVVKEPYLKAIKEECISYGGRTPVKMIEHLRMKISKVANQDKVQLKKEIFFTWEQP